MKRVLIIVFIVIMIALIVFLFNTIHILKTEPVEVDNQPISGESIVFHEVKPRVELLDYNISHDEKYGGVYVNISIEDFNNLGFEYGDSVNAMFSNGVNVIDIPYYNGYYVETDEPLLVAYPGYDYIKLGINYGDDLWNVANVSGDTTCSIFLNEPRKYLDTQKIRDIHYEDEQGDMDDETFSNFRPMNIGGLKENMIYRGASPIDNKHNRAPVTDRLLEKYGIKYIIDLADSDEEIVNFSSKEDFNSPYFMTLYNDNKVSALSMSMQYKSEEFESKLVKGLTDMANNDGPYYIHCQEGKDRTGFVCMVVDALGGATLNEIINDYMKTYDNYYRINDINDQEKYNLIKKANIDAMIKYMTEEKNMENLKTSDLSELAEKYLIRIGMNQENINKLKVKIIDT